MACLQIINAFQWALHFGVLHRDAKPHNILISTSKAGAVTAKLADFGIIAPYSAAGAPRCPL